MASKRPKEDKKDKAIHKTAKNKTTGDREKSGKSAKTANVTKGSHEKKYSSKSVQKNEKPSSNKGTPKQSAEKTLILDDDDLEGMTVPPLDSPSAPEPQRARPVVRVGQGPPRGPPPQRPSGEPPARRQVKRPPQRKSPVRRKKEESEEEDDDEEDIPVKQFSFPAYKILSGASVAPVQMHPQKVVINKSDDSRRRHWGSALTGLFQNSKLSLKLRMLRLLLIWIFFRVLNKQTVWLSDMLGIGVPDEEPSAPKAKPPPGERFIKVFREGDPNPFHVSVKRPL